MQNLLEGLDLETKVAVVQMLNDAYTQEILAAEIRQEEIARLNRERGPQRAVDGLGERTMCIDPSLYWAYKLRGKRDFRDKDWREWMLRRHPELRVETAGTKTQIGPRQFSEPAVVVARDFGARASRFHKRYADSSAN